MKLSLIFPAYNEAASITNVLERFSQYCSAKNIDHEIIVVNDGSHDETGKKVKNVIAAHPSVRLIEHAMNQGYGAALRSGFLAARGDTIFYTDSDGQFRQDDLESTLLLLGENTIVLGYRKRRAEGILRRFSAWLWNQTIAFFLHVRVRDLNCAWKVFPQTLLSDITLASNGAFISAELLYYAKKKHLAFQEIPVHHYARHAGSPTGANIRVVYKAFRELAFFLKHH